jgi:hypothetical protein
MLPPNKVQKLERVAPAALFGFVGPKNPYSAPVCMSMPGTSGTTSGVRVTHVGTDPSAAFFCWKVNDWPSSAVLMMWR